MFFYFVFVSLCILFLFSCNKLFHSRELPVGERDAFGRQIGERPLAEERRPEDRRFDDRGGPPDDHFDGRPVYDRRFDGRYLKHLLPFSEYKNSHL